MKQQAAHFSNKVARRAQKAADRWAMDYWHDFPFGRAPKADKETYLTLWEEAKNISYPEINAFEEESGHRLDVDWMHNLALHTQIVIKNSKLCYQHGRILYAALRQYLEDNKDPMITILETGTARGFSAIVMARALAGEQRPGKIITFDLLPHNIQMYWNCIDDHEGPKTRRELLEPWGELADSYVIFIENDSRIGISRTAMGRVHFAFLDGAHTYEDILIEFDMVRQSQQSGDVVIFDDYNPVLFPGIIQGVDEGCEKWGYDKKIIGSREDRAYVIARKK